MAARAGEDRAADVGVLVDVVVAEHEAGEHVARERVALFGSIHRQDHDVAVAFDRAVLGGEVFEERRHGPEQ